jgi:hypothetical protein
VAAHARGERDISVSNNSYSYVIVESHKGALEGSCNETHRKTAAAEKRALGSVTGVDVAQASAMNFATVVDRVRQDFVEMPEMELTLPQAVRLWTLGLDDCRYVIDSLVDTGFLAWTPGRTIVRRGNDPLGSLENQTANIPVLTTKLRDKSVWNQ